LWLIRKKIKLAGMLFAIYLIMNGIERFFIEKIRVNTEYNILGGITQAEIISFCLIITGLILSFLLSKKVIK
jgi:prolipoprotein diacylglyceryltransferase